MSVWGHFVAIIQATLAVFGLAGAPTSVPAHPAPDVSPQQIVQNIVSPENASQVPQHILQSAKGTGQAVVPANRHIITSTSTLRAVKPGSATIDQSSVNGAYTSFTLTGSAPGTLIAVFAALVPENYGGPTDWGSIYRSHAYVAFSGQHSLSHVTKGRWSASFSGVAPGTYKVMLYDNSGGDQSFLASRTLTVSVPKRLTFSMGSSLTFGVGQTATYGGIQITLTSLSPANGPTGEQGANFQIDVNGQSSNYPDMTAGSVLPSGSGIPDPSVQCGRYGFDLTSISSSMHTVTILALPLCKG